MTKDSNTATVRWLGTRIHRVAETDSTQDLLYARRLAGEAPHGAVVVAEGQRGGRGRLGRVWSSPPGGLWFSLLLDAPANTSLLTRLPLVTAVAVRESLSAAAGLELGLKWPNDILLGERKAGGIIVEARGSSPSALIVGIGLNTHCPAASLAEELRAWAASLIDLAPRLPANEELLEGLLARLQAAYDDLFAGREEAWMGRYRATCRSLGRTVEIDTGRELLRGLAEDIEPGGALLLRLNDGTQRRVVAGDVQHGEAPGRFPYTRGIHPQMYRERLWTMRQYAGFGSAAQTNARFRLLLARGQTGLSVAFDLPTQIGYDPDAELARGEVGKVGVSIACLADMEELLAGISLDQASISMTINATAGVLLAFLVAVARKRGTPLAALRGTLQNDILKEYVARGTFRFPEAPSLRLVTDVFRYCARELPQFNPISISGYHIREAGSTAAQELAFTLAHGIAYVEAALAVGLPLEDFAARLSFFFNAHNHLFEEVAKFRAARRMWAKIMRYRFGARGQRECLLRFHAQTAGSTLTSVQSEVNAVRVTLQALAAVLGGTQSLHTNSRDEALGLPTEASATLALRTQQVIACESGVVETPDPLGGAPYIEELTDRLEAEAQAYLDAIAERGGALAAIRAGYPQQVIQQAAYRQQQDIEAGRAVVVGVNRYQEEAGPPRLGAAGTNGGPAGASSRSKLRSPSSSEARDQSSPLRAEIFRLDEDLQARRMAAIRAHRAARAAVPCEQARARLRAAAADSRAELMPVLVEAVEAGATIGELADDLAAVFGEYQGGEFY